MDDDALRVDIEIVDFHRGLSDAQKSKIVPVAKVSSELIKLAQKAFVSEDGIDQCEGVLPTAKASGEDGCTIYEHKDFDGKSIYLYA